MTRIASATTVRGSAMWWTMLLLMTTGNEPSANGKCLASARISSMRSVKSGGERCSVRAMREHAFGGVDGGDVDVRRAAGQFDRNLGGAGAEVENFVAFVVGRVVEASSPSGRRADR